MRVPVLVSVSPLCGHRLRVRFDDGVEGEIDLRALVAFRGVFAPLADEAYADRASVADDLGTIAWPNGADLDPLVVYARVTGRVVEDPLSAPDVVAG